MYIPNSVKTAIAKTFYDKTVEVFEQETELNSEGGVVASETAKGTFTGNVRFTNLGDLQEELGLTMQIDIAITCDTSTDVAVDNLVQYQGLKYVVTSVIPSDSHLTVVGQKWQK